MASSNERSEMGANNQQTNSTRQQHNEAKSTLPAYQSRAPRNSTREQRIQELLDKPEPENAQNDQSQSRQNQSIQSDDNVQAEKLSLAEIFKETDSDNESVSDDGPVDSIDRVSKKLGLKPEQVYAIKVPMPNGAEPLTIGHLKDRVGELVDLETREVQFDQRRIKQEGQLLKAQAEMRELLGLLPREHISPEIVNKIRKKQEITMNRERAATLEHIPEWNEESVMSADKAGMAEMLEEWGFDGAAFLESVVDHRAVKFIRDMWIRDKKIKTALAKVTVPTRKGKSPSPKASKGATKPNQQSSSNTRVVGQMDQRSRIAQLFNDLE